MSARTKALGAICAGCVAVGVAWDARSEKILKPVDPELVAVAWCAYQEVPFVVYHGHRTDAEQASFIARGVTWVKRSKHQDGLAIDVMALDEKGKGTWAEKYYPKIAQAFSACSKKLNIPVIWGGTWRVRDLVHFEKAAK